MIIFQSALRLLVSLLLAMLFLQSPSDARGDSVTEAFASHGASARPGTQPKALASLPPATDVVRAFDESFASFSTVPVRSGDLPKRWETVTRQVESEASVLLSCMIQEECPVAARRFLEIIAEAREHHGLARVGAINRTVNLSIVPTSDMKQWGIPDRWSPPLETLTTGHGDCEDYAIVKYVALLDAGIRREDVKLVVVHDLLRNEDHAITVTRIEGEWIALDNRWLALVRDTELRHVTPLFVLDDTGVRAFVPETGSTRVAHVRPPPGDGEVPSAVSGVGEEKS
jgi:predicted transglutaminase-like cysteine proteinase